MRALEHYTYNIIYQKLIIINDFLTKITLRFAKLKVKMEKFGLFDIIEKLAPLKNSVKTVLPAIEKLATITAKPEEKKAEIKPKTALPSALDYIRRHEQMSKRIDQNNKFLNN